MHALNLLTAVWRKSSRSGQNGACVDVAVQRAAVGVRDSEDPAGPHLVVAPDEWAAFVSTVRADRLG